MRILLVDDHPVVLAGLEALLERQPWVTSVDTAGDASAALSAAERAPDVVVLDVGLGTESGIDLIEPLLAVAPAARILMLTMSADHDDARASIGRGAAGYLLKDSGPTEVLAAIQMVASGGTALGPAAARAVIPSPRATDIRLGDRDRELLGLVARGMSTDEIAHALFLAPKTVRNRLSDLYRVLGVANRAEAVAVAYEFGM